MRTHESGAPKHEGLPSDERKTAYYIAKNDRPYFHHFDLIPLQEMNGLDLGLILHRQIGVARWPSGLTAHLGGSRVQAQPTSLFYHVATFGRLFTPHCLPRFQPCYVSFMWYWLRFEVAAHCTTPRCCELPFYVCRQTKDLTLLFYLHVHY